MNNYITGSIIQTLRKQKNMTQKYLAELINVSDKTISKWETGKGFPDISLLETLSSALCVSMAELLSGEHIVNKNRSYNLQKSHFYICPVCGNIILSSGGAVINCCGITLPPYEAEEPDEAHKITIEPIEDEYYVTVTHDMTKDHYISFIAYVSCDRIDIHKLYPEGNAETRFAIRGQGYLLYYCNRHGLMKVKVK